MFYNIRNYIKLSLLLFFGLLLSGCSVTYDLNISSGNYYESVNVNYSKGENSTTYFIPVYYGVMDIDDPNANLLEKINGIKYYNVDIINNKIKYSYDFNHDDIIKSNFINYSYNTFILKRYDHDEDGKDDYMLLTTDDNFKIFEKYPKIDDITVNISCNYEVISSNADNVSKNVYTWYLDRENIKAINMVYNPDNAIDYRSFWEKIKDGEFLNIISLFGIILFICGVIYFVIKRRSDGVNKI